MLGTRSAGNLADWKANHPGSAVGSFADAAKFGELVLLAVKGAVAADNLKGKTVIDATNPLTDDPPVNGVHTFFTSLNESLMERLQREFPNAHFVKAFNQANNSRMVNPQFAAGRPTMFICGNDEAAKRTVTSILDQFGWETEDMGQVEAARAIEPLCMLWAVRYFRVKKWDHAFKLLHD